MDTATALDRSPMMLAVVLLLVVIEITWHRLRGSDGYDIKESAATLGVMAGQILARAATGAITVPILFLVYDHRLFDFDPRRWTALLALGLGVEFAYYWYHRLSHVVRWMWATHNVHHSSRHINLTAAFRLGWTNLLSGSWLFLLPLAWLGFHPVAILAMFSLNLTYQLFLHTETVGRLGPLEWVFNTPSHHRVHHASDTDCLDRNFGGILIIFDRLFGTFASVAPDRRLTFGLHGHGRDRPVYNPLRIVLGEWLRMISDLRRAHSLREVPSILFGRPGASTPRHQEAAPLPP